MEVVNTPNGQKLRLDDGSEVTLQELYKHRAQNQGTAEAPLYYKNQQQAPKAPSTAEQVGQIVGGQVARKGVTAAGNALFGSGASSAGAVVPAAPGGALAGSTGATSAAGMGTGAGSSFSLGGAGAAGNVILPAAGAVGLYDLFANQRKGGRGMLQGAASGAAMGSYFGPTGAVVGGGLGLAAGLVGGLGDKDMYKTEGNRLRDLEKKGVIVPDALGGAKNLTAGRTAKEQIRGDLAADFVGVAPDGKWVNNKWLNSGNKADLTGKDIWGYSAFFDKYGNDWLNKFNADQREKIANAALAGGAVNEHHGTIDINWTPELQKQADEIAAQKQAVTAPTVNAPRKEVSPPKRDPKKPKSPAPTLQDLVPTMSAPPVMPEPDDEPDELERKSIDSYKDMFAKYATGKFI